MADAGLLRQENTALLRRAMQDGVFSKNELARQTGLSFPTVGRIIDDMVERGEAREAGVAASTGGRCAMRYELDMHYRLFLCLRLEQDTLHWFVCGLDGVPLEQGEETCPGDVRELLDTLLMRVRARYPQLASVAFGFAGAMHDGVVMECFCYPELRGVSLSTHLHDKSGLPSAAARDMQIVAAGYAAQCSPAPRAAVCIYIGRMGAGAGIVYLCGDGYQAAIHTVVNALAIVSGIVCDGAKASCAAKIASSVDAALLGYNMYKCHQEFKGGDGIVMKDIETTIKGIGRLGKDGMRQTNEEIIRLMMS